MAARSSRRTIALLFAWNFAIVTAFFVGRTVRDVLFLAHESPARLPYLYIASPIVVTLVGLAYGRVAERFRRERLVVATALTLAVLAVAAYLALGPRWLYYALYVGTEISGALGIMQFWITAGERFTPRDAKRWFSVIAAGGTAANIVVGFALTALVRHTGAEALLLLVAVALVGVAVCAALLGPTPGAGPRAREKGPAAAGAVRVSDAGASHLRVLAPMIACTVLAVTLLDFQFKAITTATYGGDRTQMVQFFAMLSATTGIASFVIQLTLTGRLLSRFGVAGALLLLPTTLGLGATALLLVPSLAAATACKAADATFRYTVHDAGMQLLYLPVPRAARTRKKAFLDGVVKPGSEAAVGASLLAYRTFTGAPLGPLAIVAMIVIGVWIALVLAMRSAYVRSLAETLRRRRRVGVATGAAFEVTPLVARARGELVVAFTAIAAADGLGRAESALALDGTRAPVPFAPDSPEGPGALLSRALRERQERAAGRVLDLLAAIDPQLPIDVARLNLREPDPARRANAVELLDAHRWARPISPLKPLVLALLDESSRDDKLLAARALALPQHTADGWLAVLLADPSPWIATCAAYLRDALAGAARKDSMLSIPDKVLFLKGLELFAAVPSEDLAEVAALTDELELDDGAPLFAEGDLGDALFLVVAGRLRVTRDDRTLAELGLREVIGEMALLDPAPRSASATAVGDVRLLRLARDDFATLLGERAEIAAGVLRVLTRRLRAANQAAGIRE